MSANQSQQSQQHQPQEKITEEQAVMESFRNSIDDAISLIDGLGPQCSDLPELIGLLKLALTNDAQLRLVMNNISPKRMRR